MSFFIAIHFKKRKTELLQISQESLLTTFIGYMDNYSQKETKLFKIKWIYLIIYLYMQHCNKMKDAYWLKKDKGD
ncbi:hypothetical protein T4A_7005 [Trichinella pseudospiralis]|uniref:Uncharacterized protein n=1 Tax=Trichinella pseudospiralis TaxID=6337 RepID=A0A0V1DX52_TRIPS|nr:hypothetical protein T4A_7005 [Trichinella pseudospiralis]